MTFKQFRAHLNGMVTYSAKIEYVSGLSPEHVADYYDSYTEGEYFSYMFKRQPSCLSDKDNFEILSKFVKDGDL